MALAVRRRLLCQPAEEVAEKTIIYENYNPNRQAFSTELSASDCDLRTDDTLFFSIHLTGNTGNRYQIFQVGNDISKAASGSGSSVPTVANTSIMDWRWMAGSSTQIQQRFGVYKGYYQGSTVNSTAIIPPHDYKVALNKNGIVIDGVDMTSRYATNNFTWNNILTYLYTTESFQVGSVAYTKGQFEHSNQLINEVSIIHGFLSADEMIEITS